MSKSQGKPPVRRQRGVALLMTLSVLALLLIMAMSFAYTSKTNRLSAGISADLLQARLMCDTGLSRILASMKFCYDPTTGDPDQKVYPPTYTAADGNPFPFAYQYGTTGQYYALSADSASIDSAGLPGDLLVPGLDAVLTAAIPANTAKWLPIKQDVNRTGSPELTGRFAYLILDEGGKIDATEAVTPHWEPFCLVHDANSNGWPEGADRYYYADINADGTWDFSGGLAESTADNRRTGASLAELIIPQRFNDDLPTASRVIPTYPPATLKTRWFSLQHLFAGASLTPAEYLVLAADSYDIEAYAADNGSGTLTDYHRFDLTGYHWDPDKTNTTNGWDELASWTGLKVVQWLDSDAIEFWDSANPGQVNPVVAATGGSGGIACASEGIADDAHRYEVLASLADYCDRDPDGSGNLQHKPTVGSIGGPGRYDFVGLEQVPFLSELMLYVVYGHIAVGPGIGIGLFSIQPPRVELVNMFPQESPELTIELEIEFRIANPPPGWGFGNTFSVIWRNGSFAMPTPVQVPANDYYEANNMAKAGVPLSVSWVGVWRENIQLSVRQVHMTLFDTDGDVLDYAHWQGTFSGTLAPFDQLVPPNQHYASMQVDDPRCNTWSDRWEWFGWSDDENVGSMGSQNAKSRPDLGEEPYAGDIKDAYTLPGSDTGLSTGFIRNGPMQSLWELGAIHRGEPWRTVDLKSFSSGDAKLLSQCKIGPWTITTGKFNANSPLPAPWQVLLSNLRDDALYFNPAPAGAPSYIDAVAVVTALGLPAGSGRFVERGQVADFAPLSNYTGATTDRERESVIGRIANLLTVRQNYFTVLVHGQSVKDLGAVNPGGDDVCRYESGPDRYCRVLAQQKIVATVYRDALRNTFRVERIEYLE